MNTKPAAIQAFNCQLPRACSGLGPGLGAEDPDSHSVLALQELTLQGRKEQVKRQVQDWVTGAQCWDGPEKSPPPDLASQQSVPGGHTP